MLILAWLASLVSLEYESHEYVELSPELMEEAKDYFAANYEELPVDWIWGRLEVQEGIFLRTGYLEHSDPIGTVLIVPGFTSPIEMQARAISALHHAGYRVAAIDYRGQGGSWRPLNNPEKGYVTDYAQLADDVAAYARSIKVENKPLFFHSISMGAHISLRLSERHKSLVNAYALVVPMVEINGGSIGRPMMKRIADIATSVGLGRMYAPGQSSWPSKGFAFGQANDCNANPETAQTQSALFALNKEFRVNGVTMRWLKESLTSGERLMSADFIRQHDSPTKIFTAGDDRIVSSASAEHFCNAVSKCEHIGLSKSRHCINREAMRYTTKYCVNLSNFINVFLSSYTRAE